MDTPESDVRDWDALRLLHDACQASIRYSKEQQWRVANYSLLLIAAITGVSQLISNLQCWQVTILTFLIAAVEVAAFTCLIDLQSAQAKERNRLEDIRLLFPHSYISIVNKRKGEDVRSFWRHKTIFITLQAASAVASAIGVYLTWVRFTGIT